MRTLRFIFNFYLNASIHVALAVISLLGVTSLVLEIPLNLSLFGFVFFGTIVCYNFVKYGVEAKKYLVVMNAYHKNIQALSFFCFGLAVYFLIHLDRKIWVAVLGLGLISCLYAIPLLPKTKNLRSLGGFKIYIVALVWVGFTVLLPVLDNELDISWDLKILFLQRFILVVALILPFEIRDLQWDDPEIKTLPQIFGIYKTRMLGVILMVVFFLLTFLKDNLIGVEISMRLLVSVLLIIVFLQRDRVPRKYFASFWVEGIPILWFGIYWSLKNLY
ncbi:hypothetical protein [Flagellimonas pacifica]|uniref:Prenyltransferase n=1 Tax=Flagellimonas pacifica TaxID=1247520 RepID=A0A285MWH7_9FLAO|nr:hypothetical protein [Allomuricauda parva]SNZ01542.1 hypothetical protein SAMN06265377_3384 [Allomuricauda parva]